MFVVLTVAGVVAYQTAPPAAFGWFAYAPMADTVRVSTPPAMSGQQIGGVVLAALGLAGASATAGYLLGRSARNRRSPAGSD